MFSRQRRKYSPKSSPSTGDKGTALDPPTRRKLHRRRRSSNSSLGEGEVFTHFSRSSLAEGYSPPKNEIPAFPDVLYTSYQDGYKDVLRLYGYNWFKAKEHLAYEQYATDSEEYEKRLDLMRGLLDYRTVVVDDLLLKTAEHVASFIPGATVGQKEAFSYASKKEKGWQLHIGSQLLIVSAPGSTSTTSDYDITFIIPGREELETEAVRFFNITFRSQWGNHTSGVVFDTNVYTSGFMSQFAQVKLAPLFKRHSDTYARIKAEKHVLQMALSFLPIRQFFFMTDPHGVGWIDFKRNTVQALGNFLKTNGSRYGVEAIDRIVAREMDAIFNKTQILHGETYGQIGKTMRSLSAAMDRRGEVMDAQHLEAAAKDALYEGELHKVKKIIEERRVILRALAMITHPRLHPKRYSDLLAQLSENIKRFDLVQGKALVFANEAYYNEGAATHVVKGMQSGGKISLGRQQQMQSILMNVGYKLQHFHQHHEEGGYGRAYINTAKYGQRVRDIVMRGHSDFDLPLLKGTGATAFDPKLYDELSEDLDMLEAEEKLIRAYKKNPNLTTPSSKEEAAVRDFFGDSAPQKFRKEEIERHYIHIAQHVLGPFYLDKLESRGLGLWGVV
ncbi:hypothetical protein FUAX_24640 [Fulvitalea axinellae]|uniref:Nucleotidyltransferase n=1 Tax=Fulvitalea axinellae TaxID=1182444 RepID=A0AAU9CQ00_9BACT|nr:hypothetical protein FUAX_24640 [Fulvitalea axinellae]